MGESRETLKYILNQLKLGNIKKEVAIELIKKTNTPDDDGVAIIGMGCKTAFSDKYEDVWDVLINKETMINKCPRERIDLVKRILYKEDGDDENLYYKGAFMKDFDMFDYELFDFTKEEARALDPTQRVMLQVAYRTLEDAGYLGEKLINNNTGVFIGINYTWLQTISYLTLNGYNNFDALLLNWTSGLATRISNIFDLRGPAITMDNSCPSSTTAIYAAYKAIKDKQCTTALAGGVSTTLLPAKIIDIGWIFNHDDSIITRAFDDNPGGCYLGEGGGALLLKSLKAAIEDGDRIHAIIRGGSINNNGKNGNFNKSSVEDVKKVTIDAIKDSRINVEDVGYFEGEGYCERLEEALQLSGISEGFKKYTKQKQYCGIGSLSANLGYLQSAVGVFSAIKCILAMKNKTIPPMYRFIKPNQLINICNTPFYVTDMAKNWAEKPNRPRCAGTYSYGFGGTNVVIFYEEAPELPEYEEEDREELFVLSAKSKEILLRDIDSYIEFLMSSEKKNFSNICYTTCIGRTHYLEYRLAIIAKNCEDLLSNLIKFKKDMRNSANIYCGLNTKNKSASIKMEESKKIESAMYSKQLNIIADLFCKGITFEFQPLYEQRNVRICNVPRYKFNKTSCWVLNKEESY